MHMYVYMCMYIYMCVYIYIYIYTYIYKHINMNVHILPLISTALTPSVAPDRISQKLLTLMSTTVTRL